MSEPGDGPRLGLTTRTAVVSAAVVGALVAGAVTAVVEAASAFPPVVPWSVPAVMAAVAVAAWTYASSLRGRVARHEVAAPEAVRALGAGKSMVLTGAALAGGHVVYALPWLTQLSVPQPAARVLTAGVTVAAGVALALAGWALERACRVPDDDGDDADN